MSIDPMYANQALSDCHPTNAAMNNTAIPMGLVFDQEKAVRNQATPDIGALEFLSPACAGTPSLNSVTSPSYAICPGEDVTMTLGTLYSNTGYAYQWSVSNTSNVGPWTPISGATNLFYTAPSVTANTWYQVVQTCTLPGGAAISPVGTVVVAGPSSSVVPYFEDFEGIGLNNRLPNCSWSATGIGSQNQTYVSAQSGNRVPRSGVSFATFDNSSVGTSAYYTNPIAMNVGITYSAALWYATEYFGYNNWSNLSIWVGPNQNQTGMVQVASVGPALSGQFKLLDGTFTVPSNGNYYVAIRATSAAGSAQYLTWDDLSITIPCTANSNNNPTITVTASSQTVCAGSTVYYTATGADSYQWGTVGTGSTYSETPMTPGDYTLTVIGTNSVTSCPDIEMVAIHVDPAPNVFVIANNPIACAGSPVILSAYGALTYNWSNGNTNPNITVTQNASTSYTVVGVNSFGCSNTYVANITVVPNPTATISSSSPVEACKDDMIQLSAFGSATTYQWLSNINSQVYMGNPITIQASASTNFTVLGTNSNGCVGKTTFVQNISDCVGLSKNVGSAGILVYPNPTTGEFVVELGNSALTKVNVVDVTGRVVLSATNDGNRVNMNISRLAAGIYYVTILSDNTNEVVKIVKQ